MKGGVEGGDGALLDFTHMIPVFLSRLGYPPPLVRFQLHFAKTLLCIVLVWMVRLGIEHGDGVNTRFLGGMLASLGA